MQSQHLGRLRQEDSGEFKACPIYNLYPISKANIKILRSLTLPQTQEKGRGGRPNIMRALLPGVTSGL